MAKVKYGLKNVHYAVWDPEKSQYKTPHAALPSLPASSG